MVVTVALIQAADRSLTEAEATAALTAYEDVAAALLDADDPGLTETLYDWCHALLICHLRSSGDPASGLKGYKSGDYSETRDPGVTTWLLQYREIIEQASRGAPTVTDAGVIRSDAVMEDLQLDTADVLFYPDDVDPDTGVMF